MIVTLESHPFGCYIVRGDSGESCFLQSADDMPRLAEAFGWFPSQTRDYGEMVSDARDFLDEHVGSRAIDPGYL